MIGRKNNFFVVTAGNPFAKDEGTRSNRQQSEDGSGTDPEAQVTVFAAGRGAEMPR